MMQQSFLPVSLLLLFLFFAGTLAKSPAAAPAKAPPVAPVQAPPVTSAKAPTGVQVPVTSGPTNVAKILDKAGHFTVFLRLMKAIQEDRELNSELNNNNGVTIFAPGDGAFSGLKIGTLNTLSDNQKAELLKFHIIPKFMATSQFQTESNPVTTQAGTGGRISLNVTVTGNAVNISTGLTNASISGTVYTDSNLAIYEVDKVLLPLDIFTPKPPAPAPGPALAPEKPKKDNPDEENSVVPKDVSRALSELVQINPVFLAVLIVSTTMCSW